MRGCLVGSEMCIRDSNQTNANEANSNIIEQIDNGNEIIIEENDTQEEEGNFFQRLFKGKKK